MTEPRNELEREKHEYMHNVHTYIYVYMRKTDSINPRKFQSLFVFNPENTGLRQR